MAVYYGKIGFMETEETDVSVWTETIKEYSYSGRVLKNSKSWSSSDKENDDLRISGRISILADPYAREHFHSMRYICWMGTKWKITDVEVSYPRLILTIGEEYNGELTASGS